MKFRLTFNDYESAWHQNVQERIQKYKKEHPEDKNPISHDLYYNSQFDDIPYIEWEKIFGKEGTEYPDPENFPEFVEFEI